MPEAISTRIRTRLYSGIYNSDICIDPLEVRETLSGFQRFGPLMLTMNLTYTWCKISRDSNLEVCPSIWNSCDVRDSV